MFVSLTYHGCDSYDHSYQILYPVTYTFVSYIYDESPLWLQHLWFFFSSKFLIYILLSMNAFLFIFSGMLFLWLYQSNKFMVISYNNAKTIQVNTIAHKIVPTCVVVAICLGTLIWQEVRHLTHSIRSSEFTRLCFKATHLVLLLLLH